MEDLWPGSVQERLAGPQGSGLWTVRLRTFSSPVSSQASPSCSGAPVTDRPSLTTGPEPLSHGTVNLLHSTVTAPPCPFWACDSGTDAKVEKLVFSQQEPTSPSQCTGWALRCECGVAGSVGDFRVLPTNPGAGHILLFGPLSPSVSPHAPFWRMARVESKGGL